VPVGGRPDYFLRGARPEESAPTLEEALAALLDFWNSRRSLAVHQMGNLAIDLTLGSELVHVEITDALVIEDYQGVRGPTAVLDALVEALGIDPVLARSLIEGAHATVRVDTLQIASDPNAWRPEPGMEPEVALPAAAPRLLGQLLQESDRETARGVRRRRTPEGEALIRSILAIADTQGLSLAEAGRRSGIPRETLRDARARMYQETETREARLERAPRARLTRDDEARVEEALATWGGNAAEVGRRLGMPARTVRDVRDRLVREATTPAAPERAPKKVPRGGPAPETPARRTWTSEEKRRVLRKVGAGVPASEAGRSIGVPARTARQWVEDAKRRKKRRKKK